VRLTAEGRRRFAVMAREHEQWVIALLGGLTQDQQHRLFELLGELKRALAGRGGAAARARPSPRARP
jgi:DNA-binding MarR family transcriptional regulator